MLFDAAFPAPGIGICHTPSSWPGASGRPDVRRPHDARSALSTHRAVSPIRLRAFTARDPRLALWLGRELRHVARTSCDPGCAPAAARHRAGTLEGTRDSGGELVPRLARLAERRRLPIQPRLREDLLHRRPLEDRRDDLELPGAAPRAVLQVDVEDALEQPRPAEALRSSPYGSTSLAAATASVAGRPCAHRPGAARGLRRRAVVPRGARAAWRDGAGALGGRRGGAAGASCGWVTAA
jgi:hypothetical protein